MISALIIIRIWVINLKMRKPACLAKVILKMTNLTVHLLIKILHRNKLKKLQIIYKIIILQQIRFGIKKYYLACNSYNKKVNCLKP